MKNRKKSNILITGCQGQVGWELQRTLVPLGKIFAFDRQQLDLSNSDSIAKAVREINPDVIVNAAAYTSVDKAESEQELCCKINREAPGILAEEAKKLKALLIHYSTDYVFDGQSVHPYKEDDTTNPLNIYGKSKLAGEQAIQAYGPNHLILRTSWVYGTRGKNFLLTMLRLAKEKSSLKIVQDQVGAPTWSNTIAEATADLIQKYNPEHSGIYHLTASGKTSWFDFAGAIFRIWNEKNQGNLQIPELVPIPSSEYPTPAQRPKNSVLSHQKLNKTFSIHMPQWEKALEMCLQK